MTDATVLLDAVGRESGSAFLCPPGVGITANHVLKGRPADRIRVRGAKPAESWPVREIDRDERLDVAMVTLAGPRPAPLLAADAAVDDRWVVTSRPAPNDPQLTGRVVATDRLIVNDGGTELAMLQLDVDQPLGDFGGYSGSAVRLRARPGSVLGVLCEQVHSRFRGPDGARAGASTVLYAVPIRDVVRRFDLPLAGDDAHRHFTVVRESLRAGDPDGADRALARITGAARDAGYWFWRARTAGVRHNRDAESAFLDLALKCDDRHPPALIAKITQLLLTNDPGDRAAAARLADEVSGTSPELDAWTDCLRVRGLFGPGLRSATELTRFCPPPDREWPLGVVT
jgi:hypothetical protein